MVKSSEFEQTQGIGSIELKNLDHAFIKSNKIKT